MAYICMYRIHDIDDRDDEVCIRCWRDSQECNGILFNSYLSREDCMDEFLVTESEFDVLERKRKERQKKAEALKIAPLWKT